MQGVLGYIALGANLGDRTEHLRAALRGLQAFEGLLVLRQSPIYETAAHTLEATERSPAYLNAVIEVATTLAPVELLRACQRLERKAGRIRRRRWAPRTLDLDLLSLGTLQLRGPRLTLPHPRLAVRRFVLQPWADLSPNHYIDAPHCATVGELLKRCGDAAALNKTTLAWQDLEPECFDH